MDRNGFTLVEVTIALVVLAVGVLGIALTTGTLGRMSAGAEMEALALEAVNERLSVVLLHPAYAQIDSLYEATEDLEELPGHTRETDVDRVISSGTGGLNIDYVRITVTVSGPRLDQPVSRTAVLGAP